MPELRLDPAPTLDGRPLRLRTRRAESLFLFLALHPGDHDRTGLVAEFWPEDPPESARQKLRLALLSIREAVGECLVADRRFVRLTLSPLDAPGDDPLPGVEGAWAERYRRTRSDVATERLRAELAIAPDRTEARERLRRLDPDDRDNIAALARLYRRSIRRDGSGRTRLARLRADHPWVEAGRDAIVAALPAPTDGFHGREAELADLAERLLGDEEPVWVTLRAPGGMGKTRLARELLRLAPAADVRPVFVPLADVRDGESARARAVAALFAGGEGGSLDLLPPTLLVLDNLEQIGDPGPLADLAAPGRSLRVLGTSQAPTELPGETIVDLGPLGGSAEEEDGPSLRLFLDRAERTVGEPVGPMAAAVRVCRRLGGQPLAIELAAATLDLMDLPTLAERIDRSVPELAAKGRTARHRSLRASVEWSLGLVPERARRSLGLLAAVDGAPDRAAIGALWDDPDLVDLPLLRDRCLIARRPGARPRFEVPRPIRDVVEGSVPERDRAAALLRWREHYFRTARALEDPGVTDAEAVFPDFLAMEEAIRDRLGCDPADAFEAVDRLSSYWIAAGVSTARPELVLACREAIGPPHWRSAFVLARLATIREDWDESLRWTALWAEDLPEEERVHRNLARANAAFVRAMTTDSVGGLAELRSLAPSLEFNEHTMGIGFQILGRAEEVAGSPDAAEAAYRKVVEEVRDPFWLGQRSHSAWFLAGLLWATGRREEARRWLDEAESGFREAHEPFRRPEICRGWIRIGGPEEVRAATAELLELATATARPDLLRHAAMGAAFLGSGDDPDRAALARFAIDPAPRLLAERREVVLLTELAGGGRALRPTAVAALVRARL